MDSGQGAIEAWVGNVTDTREEVSLEPGRTLTSHDRGGPAAKGQRKTDPQ